MRWGWTAMGVALLAAALAAQSGRVTGLVVAANGLPVAGAEVRAANGPQTRSDGEGRFALAAPAGTELRVSAPGYAAQTVAAGAQPLRVVLQAAALSESVTVTATARNQTTASVPLATAVMGAARLEAAAPSNVDALLRRFSDLATFRESSSLSAHPTTQGVSLLGTGSSGASRALVLLDGVPLNDFYGGWVDWLRVPTADLVSISVVAGGASPVYGNDALTGVIGMQTRVPAATHVEVRSGGGELGTALASGAGSVVRGDVSAGVRAQGVRVGGFVPVAMPGAVDRRAGVAAQDWAPFVRWTVAPRALLTASAEYFAENRRNGTVLQVNGTRLRQLALGGILEDHGVWQGNVFTQTEDFDSTFSALADDRNSEKLVLQQQVPSAAQGAGLDWTLARSRWSVTAGGSVTHITAVDNETTPQYANRAAREENGRQRLGGGFLETTWTPGAGWTWTAALRRDGWRNYGAFQNTPTALTPYPARTESAWSPSLGTVWAARPWLALRLSGYESFRAPTLNELYRPFRVGNVQTLANPLLSAERYRGAQVGAVVAAGHGLDLQATYFDGWITNLVASVTLRATPTLITRQRQNLGRVRPRGVTLDARWQPRTGWALWTSYTHLDSRVISAAEPALVGLQTAHVPQNAFSGRALAALRGWTLSAAERFGGRSFDDDQNQFVLPAFWNTDVYASRSFGRWAPYVAVTNLWNRRYAVELTPGVLLGSPRAATAGVRWRWGGE